MLTSFSTFMLAVVVAAIIFGATVLGIVIGRSLARRRTGMKEPLGVVQAALVGFVALLLAFGLTMAVGRYQSRRDAVVVEANAIGTTYLRAQTLAEPMRTSSLQLLKRYTDARIASVRLRPRFHQISGCVEYLSRVTEPLVGAGRRRAQESADRERARLYVETLNEMIDAHTSRIAALDNRIPAPVLWLQVFASALALGVLGMFLAAHDRGVFMALLAAGLVTVMLLVIFDLDRPHRGLITISDAALVSERAYMNGPPAATGP